jgi:1-acyl-sn-glycerol-3-phosphate acyltransferase
MGLENLAASLLCGFAKLVTGVRPIWHGSRPDTCKRVYYANHRSHGDFVLIWASLPREVRQRTRPVAGADYWLASAVRRYVANRVFHGVLIDRVGRGKQGNPIELMGQALSDGDSLIIFPEGTRNMGEGLLPFKSGIYYLAKAHPDVEFIPVWIENLGRVMPKGSFIPAPLLCSLTFGAPVAFDSGETKEAFLERARTALLDLAPHNE